MEKAWAGNKRRWRGCATREHEERSGYHRKMAFKTFLPKEVVYREGKHTLFFFFFKETPGLTYWGQELWCWSALEHNPHCRRAPRGQKAAFFTPLSVSHCLGWLRVGGRLGLFSQGRSLLLAEGNSLERWTIMSP